MQHKKNAVFSAFKILPLNSPCKKSCPQLVNDFKL